jgi:hypothetical protein
VEFCTEELEVFTVDVEFVVKDVEFPVVVVLVVFELALV